MFVFRSFYFMFAFMFFLFNAHIHICKPADSRIFQFHSYENEICVRQDTEQLYDHL